MKIVSHGVALRDEQLMSLEAAERLLAKDEARAKGERRSKAMKADVARARRILVSIEQVCAARAEIAAAAGRVAELADCLAEGEALLEVGGYVRLPKHDGLAALILRGHLTKEEGRAGWMYRQLFSAEPGRLRPAAMERSGGGGPDVAFRQRAVEGYDLRMIAQVTADVAEKAGLKGLALLDAVARHGLPLRAATGGGKAWELGLDRLRRALVVARLNLDFTPLDRGEQ